MEKKEIINASFLFGGLEEGQLERVSSLAVSRKYRKGEMIFFEGDPADGFYMVAEGKIKVFKVSPGGKEQILHVFGQGEPFGEVAVFYGRPFPASASTMSACEVLFFPKKEFVQMVTENPELALSLLAMLSIRLRRFVAQVESLTLKEVPARLVAHLQYLAEEQGRTDLVVLDIPKGQLASLLGTAPETLSRIFSKMTAEGLIKVSGKTINLLDPEGLARIYRKHFV
ncbi:MAG: transcriptional regulator [Desulfobulbus propionicus]|nr:MAG: transcriptional regulator [Desulfobulbus propionicus]